ncbi:helix-turn-helix transcriptional regulator [Flavobacterium sp.]|uniref:helix-turn-helix domain-containing protein n=1 Tax=Flavobacterium sp. TaxID=239 RepID=UPI0025B91008|nr:helix-turn-helix transcriptional regulator [Flavobacterium sp.]MBA4155530.1 XRE family transcriptional regulator [Flavobacterium sp.]
MSTFVTENGCQKNTFKIQTNNIMEATTGLVIKGLRERYGYTQEKLANFLDVKREMISFYETNEREVPLEFLEKLSDLFGVELSIFFSETVEEAMAEVVFAFRKDSVTENDMEKLSAFGKIVKIY